MRKILPFPPPVEQQRPVRNWIMRALYAIGLVKVAAWFARMTRRPPAAASKFEAYTEKPFRPFRIMFSGCERLPLKSFTINDEQQMAVELVSLPNSCEFEFTCRKGVEFKIELQEDLPVHIALLGEVDDDETEQRQFAIAQE